MAQAALAAASWVAVAMAVVVWATAAGSSQPRASTAAVRDVCRQHGAYQRSARCMLKLILGGWAASLLTSTGFLCVAAGRREVIGGVITHVLALPILRLPSRAMPPIGCAVMGVLLGFLLVDCCFDLLVLLGEPDGGEGKAGGGRAAPDEARRAAFAYYHTILNTLHINSVLWIAMLALVLAAARGLQEAQGGGGRVWARLLSQVSCTNALYVFTVMPRYLAIRAAGSGGFEPAFFDDWWQVLAVRCLLIASITWAGATCVQLTVAQGGGGQEAGGKKAR